MINLVDKNGVKINEGDLVSLEGNITTDNTLGHLPNGWTFDENDIYEVYFDNRINNWSLKLGVEPDSDYNRKYMNHAVFLLHNGHVKKILKYASGSVSVSDPPFIHPQR